MPLTDSRPRVNEHAAPLRHDWTREEVRALFDLPFPELMFRAQSVHRATFRPDARCRFRRCSRSRPAAARRTAPIVRKARRYDDRRARGKADAARRRARRSARRARCRRQPLLHGRGLALAQGPRPRAGLRHGRGRQGAGARDLRHARHADRRSRRGGSRTPASTTTITTSTRRPNSTARSSPRGPIRIASRRSSMCALPASMSAAAASSAWARRARTASA